MTRGEMGALALSAAACLGVALCLSRLNAVSARLDEAARPPEPAADRSADNSALAREVQRLRAQVASLEGRLAQNPAVPGVPAGPEPAAGSTHPRDTSLTAAPRTPTAEEVKRQAEWLEKRAQTIGTWLQGQLTLTDQQRFRAESIVLEAQTSLKDAFLKRDGTVDQKTITQQVYADMDARIRALLTSEQSRAYDAIAAAPGGLFGQAFSRTPGGSITLEPAGGPVPGR